MRGLAVFFAVIGWAAVAAAAPSSIYLVRQTMVTDEKAVFATVQSAYTVPARVRTAGTIIALKVRQGDQVARGQVIATVGDPKLALEIRSYSAQVSAAQAQLAQAKLDYDRASRLVGAGAIARNMYDQAQTAYNVARSNLNSITAQRAVIEEQQVQGQVLAPTSGRVISVPVTAGTVTMAGDVVATVAERNFVLRLQVPERHARFLKRGAPVRLDGADLGFAGTRSGAITLIYPQVDNGHVVADASVEGLGDYFVGQRLRVWIGAGERPAILVPADMIVTRAGIDYVRLSDKGMVIDAPVQRGEVRPQPAGAGLVEILSGLRAGDRLIKP